MQVGNPFSRPANQDRKHFDLGTSTAVPAPGYFAGVLGVKDEQVIKDAISGLGDHEIEDALFNLFQNRQIARDFIRWRVWKKK
jgi:hypothetical protein